MAGGPARAARASGSSWIGLGTAGQDGWARGRVNWQQGACLKPGASLDPAMAQPARQLVQAKPPPASARNAAVAVQVHVRRGAGAKHGSSARPSHQTSAPQRCPAHVRTSIVVQAPRRSSVRSWSKMAQLSVSVCSCVHRLWREISQDGCRWACDAVAALCAPLGASAALAAACPAAATSKNVGGSQPLPCWQR